MGGCTARRRRRERTGGGVESGKWLLVLLAGGKELEVKIKLTVQPSVHVHESVQKVLPSVENENSHKELHRRNKHVVDDLGRHHFPAGKDGRRGLGAEERIVASSNGAGKHGMRGRHALGNGRGVETKNAKEARQHALGETDPRRPDSNVIFTLAYVLGRVGQLQDGTRGDLDYLLDDDVAGDLVARGVVAAQDFLGRVQAVLRKEIERINEMENGRHGPVDGDGQDEGQPKVGAPRDEVGLGDETIFRQRRKGRVEEGAIGHGGRWVGRFVDHDLWPLPREREREKREQKRSFFDASGAFEGRESRIKARRELRRGVLPRCNYHVSAEPNAKGKEVVERERRGGHRGRGKDESSPLAV